MMHRKSCAILMVLTASLSGLSGTPVRAGFVFQQGFAIGPNGPDGSPSYPTWQDNAITGIRNGFTDVGNFATDPTAFHPVTTTSVRDVIPTSDFTSWRGVANPTGAFANELGSVIYNPVHITGTQGTRFSLSQVVFTAVSSDLPNDPAGSLLGATIDLNTLGYNPGRVGVIHNANGTTTFITSGSGDQLVDELLYRGVVTFHQDLIQAGSGKTGQQLINQEIATLSQFGNLTYTATYAIYKDATSRDPGSILASNTAQITVNAVPAPASLIVFVSGGPILLGATVWRRRKGARVLGP